MTTVLGTLGFHPEKLLPIIPKVADVRTVVIFRARGQTPDAERKSKLALEQSKRMLSSSGLKLEVCELSDPWSVTAMLAVFVQKIKECGAGDCIFNITGGTKTMSLAGALACLLTGARAYYVPEEIPGTEPFALPLPAGSMNNLLSPAQARVLKEIECQEGRSQRELGQSMRLADSTISAHISSLKAIGAVTVDGDGGSRVPNVTETGRILMFVESQAPEKNKV